MKKALITLLIMALSAITFSQQSFPGIVVGEGLGWESNELNLTIMVMETSFITLGIYSPGFDPSDYRAEWQNLGRELGDERYDQGRGKLQADFLISNDNGQVLANKSYGVEPHRSDVLYSGTFEPGEYVLSSSFFGLGKNAFIYTFETNNPNALQIFIEPYQAVVNPIVTNYNIARGEWQNPFNIHNNTGRIANIGIYDGDGPFELLFRLRDPSGGESEQPVSGDLQWLEYNLDQQGIYNFAFMVPSTAYQYTNTIALRADCRLRLENNTLTCVTPPRFQIDKRVVSSGNVCGGDTITYNVTVSNVGGTWGLATLQEILPLTLAGENLQQTFGLHPGESRNFTVQAQVLENANSQTQIVNTATVSGKGGTASASATVGVNCAGPAKFTLNKVSDRNNAVLGETINYTITVQNVGEDSGVANIVDTLPNGLEGTALNESIALTSGQIQSFNISARVVSAALGTVENCAILRSSVNNLQSCAPVTIDPPVTFEQDTLPPKPDPPTVFDPAKIILIKQVEPIMAEVGQVVTFILTAKNASEVTRDFTLKDNLSEFLEGQDFFESFTLAAGEERAFTFNARVLEGAPKEIANEATLSSEGHEATSTATILLIEPPVVPAAFSVHKETVKEVVNVGDSAEFIITVTNIGGNIGKVTLTDRLSEGLQGENIEKTFRLEAGEVREFNISGIVQEDATEVITNTAILESDFGTQTSEASIKVRKPEAIAPQELPDFKQARFSEVDINFSSQNVTEALEELSMSLVTHLPPEGSTYEAGSSHLNGQAIADPFIDEQGRLYWLFPTKPEGSINYRLEHQGNLPPLAEPTLTIRTPERDALVLGGIPFNQLEIFGLDAEILAPGRYLGEIELLPIQINVGNRELIEIGMQLSDELVGSQNYITVDTNLEPVIEDSEPLVSGYQLSVDENGYALLQLEPRPSVERLKIEVAYDDVIESGSILLLGANSRYYQYHLSISGRLLNGELAMEGFAQGYAEWPIGAGTLQVAVDVGATILPDSNLEVDTERGLVQDIEPTERFPVTGSGNEAESARRSADGIAASYSTENVHVGYYDSSPDVPAVSSIPSLTGLHAEVEIAENLLIEGFGALVADDLKREVFDLDGTRIYSLPEGVKRSSERVILLTSKEEIVLERHKDYSIDYLTGNIILSKALWFSDKNFNPLRLQIDYAPLEATREAFAFGGGIEYSNSNFTFGIGAVNLNKDNDFEFGARLGYNSKDFAANLGYIGRFVDDELESTFTVAASAQRNIDRIESDISLSYNLEREEVKGRGRLAYNIFSDGWIALEHNAVFDDYNLTSLAYEQHFFDNFGLGAGLGYDWEEEAINGVIRGLYRSDNLSVNVTHAQPFNADEEARSDLTANYQIDENLSADASVSYLWDNEVVGIIGLNQRIGDANLSLDYKLPTASGEGNRARFGVVVPLPLTSELSTDFSGGYERDIDSEESEAAFGVALRYDNSTFNATIGSEVSIPSESDNKVTLRAGASGQLTENQVVSANANYQVTPELNGRANIGYAYRGSAFNILTYHNLTYVENSSAASEKNLLEGELALAYAVSNALQLRPGVAYRMDINESDNSIYQFSLGSIYYLDLGLDFYTTTLGLGGYGHYRWQPGRDSSAWGATFEVKAQLLEPLWFSLGYTFTDSSIPSVNDDFSSGLVLRFDFIGAWQALFR